MRPELLSFQYQFSSAYYFLQNFHVTVQNNLKTFNIPYNYKLTKIFFAQFFIKSANTSTNSISQFVCILFSLQLCPV